MDRSEDEFLFHFRHPSSDEDSDSNSGFEDFDAYPGLEDASEYSTIGRVVEAYDLAVAIQAVTVALSEERHKKDGKSREHDRESTISGPPLAFEFADLDLSPTLANLVEIYFDQMPVMEENTTEVRRERTTAVDESPHETDLLPIGKQIRQKEISELEGGVTRSRTEQKEMIGSAIQENRAESASRRSSEGAEKCTSPQERLRARFLNPSYHEMCYLCFKCCTQQNGRHGCQPYEQCMLCSRSTSWGQYKDGTIKWITAKALHENCISSEVAVVFQPMKSSLFFELYETNQGRTLPRAILLKLPSGNILWDCITTLYEDIMAKIAKAGGIRSIAISSPDHMRNCDRMSYIFNRCPIYLNNRVCLNIDVDRKSTRFWDTPKEHLWDGVTLIHLGGHFPGSCILHLNRNGGIVFSGNTLKVGADKQTVSVMLDYNFQFPASPKDVLRILHIMEDLEFDELYGDLPGDNIVENAKKKVIFSLRRYIAWIQHNEDAIQLEPLTQPEIVSKGKRKIDDT